MGSGGTDDGFGSDMIKVDRGVDPSYQKIKTWQNNKAVDAWQRQTAEGPSKDLIFGDQPRKSEYIKFFTSGKQNLWEHLYQNHPENAAFGPGNTNADQKTLLSRFSDSPGLAWASYDLSGRAALDSTENARGAAANSLRQGGEFAQVSRPASPGQPTAGPIAKSIPPGAISGPGTILGDPGTQATNAKTILGL